MSSTEKEQLVTPKDIKSAAAKGNVDKPPAAVAATPSTKDSFTTPSDSKSLIEYKLTFYENIWRLVFGMLLLFGSVAVYKVYLFHTSPETENIKKGHISDFWVSIVAAIIIGGLRSSIRRLMLVKIASLLSEKRLKTIEEGNKRADQLCKWVFDFTYYSITTIVGYLIVKDEIFLPPTMFGTGQCSNLFTRYPEVPEIPFLRLFYLVQTGTHLYTFVHQFAVKLNDPKFYEYALHHGLALFLLWFSYMMNFVLIGVVVLLLHDPSDVFLIAGRAYTDLKNRKVPINIALYVLAIPTWIYTRNIIFPSCVITTSFEQLGKHRELDHIVYLPKVYMVFMLSALAFMHVYWTFFLARAAVSMLSKGKDKNGYDS